MRTMIQRRQRFVRSSEPRRIEITNRDREILRVVHSHRFVSSRQIAALLSEPGQTLLRRLNLLYHHGYLERPRCQLDYYYRGGSRPMVYALGNKGAEVLRRHGLSIQSNRLSEKNTAIRRPYFEHVLFVAEVIIAIELTCRKTGVRFISHHELIGDTPLRWRAKIDNETELDLMPDSAFALEYEDANKGRYRAYFFLEADRGTMPVNRKGLAQSSIYRKFLAYQATWQQGLHRNLFGFHRFRVITVTASTERMHRMIDCCSRLQQGHGLFLFSTHELHHPAGSIATWHTARGAQIPLVD